MGIPHGSHYRQGRDTRWAWWLFLVLSGSTLGWFWLLGHDLHLERKVEPPNATTAKAAH